MTIITRARTLSTSQVIGPLLKPDPNSGIATITAATTSRTTASQPSAPTPPGAARFAGADAHGVDGSRPPRQERRDESHQTGSDTEPLRHRQLPGIYSGHHKTPLISVRTGTKKFKERSNLSSDGGKPLVVPG